MSEQPIRHDQALPPATEQVHLPGPSYLPVIVAAGVTIALIGLVHNVVIAAIGLLVAVGAIVRWVVAARSEIADLPLDHR